MGRISENLNDSTQQLGMQCESVFFLIYALAAQFENFLLPFIIIGSIPLSLIGIIVGLLVFNQPIDVMVMVGLILLAGVVVNNAIVLINYSVYASY